MGLVRWGVVLLAVLGLAACHKPGEVDAKRLMAAAGNAEWLSYGKDYNEQRFSPEACDNFDEHGVHHCLLFPARWSCEPCGEIR